MIADREGRFEDALAGADLMLTRLTELGLRVMVTAPMGARAQFLHQMGDLDASARQYEEVIDLHRKLGQTAYLSTTLIDYANTLYAKGDMDEAERLAIEGERLGSPEDTVNFAQGRALRAAVAADRGEDEAALDLIMSALEYAHQTDFPAVHGRAEEMLAHVHRRAGRVEDARGAYQRALEIWERYDFIANAKRVRDLLVEL
jgi:tetratricopeptide (TPR) repeat protein